MGIAHALCVAKMLIFSSLQPGLVVSKIEGEDLGRFEFVRVCRGEERMVGLVEYEIGLVSARDGASVLLP